MSDSMNEQLGKVRKDIDRIDKQMQDLICQRVKCVDSVAKIKRQAGQDAVFYRPEREAQVLREIMQRDCGGLPEKEMAKIFRAIMSACLALQQPLSIAFLGPIGTFSQEAVVKHFGPSVKLVPQSSIADVFHKVETNELPYGVVPIENSIGGLVNPTMQELIKTDNRICGEVRIAIHQNLMLNPELTKDIKRIYSHQQSLLQCKQWLKANYPHAEFIEVSSNAFAAEKVVDEKGSAAVAGVLAAEQYGLTIIAEDIADRKDNNTRFLIIGKHMLGESGEDKTSLLISAQNEPGLLEKVILPLSENKVNLCMIKSQASAESANEILFFLDLEEHCSNNRLQAVLAELAPQPLSVKVLGSYPVAVL